MAEREQPSARSKPDSAASKGASRPGAATWRQLGLALSGVLLSLVLAFGVEVYTLRSMDRIIDSMEDRDEEVQLTLQVEAALDELYAEQTELLHQEGAELTRYEEARHHALTLLQRLEESAHDPRSAEVLAAVRQATRALSVNMRETRIPTEFSVEGRAWTST